MYREVGVIEIREVLRLWLRQDMGLRPIAGVAGVDRKTARRYIDAAVGLGVDRDGGPDQLTDELIGGVVNAVRPDRPQGHGQAWEACQANGEAIKGWVEDGVPVAKIETLLARRGTMVPYRTLHRYCVQTLGFGPPSSTVPVVDSEPGIELQADFGRLGLINDCETGSSSGGVGVGADCGGVTTHVCVVHLPSDHRGGDCWTGGCLGVLWWRVCGVDPR